MRTRLLLTLILTVTFQVNINSSNRYFSHLTMDDGLSHYCVNAIAQDSNGFVWIGTRNGLSRYDGSRIRVFECSDPLTGHGNNNISALYSDPHTGLWCGTDKGVYIWSPDTETFREFTYACEDGRRVSDWIASIEKDSYGNMWIVAPNQGVFRFRDGVLHHYDIDLPECMYIRKNGQVWIGTYASGLFIYDHGKDSFDSLHTDREGNSLLGNYVFSMCEWDSVMAIAIHDGALKYLDLRTMTFGTMDAPQIHNTMIRGIGSFGNNLWVCTQEGLFVIDGQDKSITHIRQDFMNPYSLSSKACSVLCADSEGGIWVGTLTNGVNYCPASNFIIDKYVLYDRESQVLYDNIKTISQGPDGRLWIGTENEGICSFDPQTGETSALERKFCEDRKLLNTLGSYVSRDGRYLYIGFFKRGFAKVDMVTGKMTHYNPEDYGINESSIYSFCRDSWDNLWLGTASGVYCRKAGERKFHIVDTLKTFWAFDIMEDSHRNVWFASLGGGIYRYGATGDGFEYFSHDASDPKSLSMNSVSSISEDKSGVIWFSTDRGGLSGYRYETGEFANYSVKDGFPDDVSYRVLEERSGALWFGTNKGLVRFQPAKAQTRVFTRNEGLTGNQFNYHSAMKSSDGRLWFGGMSGLVSIDPEQHGVNMDNTPKICFTGLVVNNEEQKAGESGSVLDRSLLFTDRIVLRYNQSSLKLEFADLRFSQAGNTEYYYMMEGAVNEWVHVDGDKSVSFARLAPGDYRLHIRAVSVNGHRAVAEKSIAMTVRQPWWSSLLAKIFYASVVIAAGTLTVTYLYRRKKRQMEVQKSLFEIEKEKELYSAKVNFFNEIAHEIRTPLTLIKGPIEDAIALNDDRRLSKSLRTVSTNTDRLLELVNQLLDFRNVDSNRTQLDYVPSDIPELLGKIVERFEPTMVHRGKTFGLDLGNEEFRATVDREAFTKIISNLLTNAIKYSEKNISVGLLREGTMFSVRVSNDGEKIPLHLSEKIFEPFFRIDSPDKAVTGTGIGLPLARSLATMHKGHLYLDTTSALNSFVLTLPLEQDRVINIGAASDAGLFGAQEPEQTILEDEVSAPDAKKNYRVLIVEDNAAVLQYLTERLSESCNVMAAENGAKALEIMASTRPDLVVSDIMMPVMNGLELCRRMKNDEEFRSIPVVFLTAKNDMESKLEGLRTGAEAFVEKPFSPDYLKALIFSIMDNRRKEREDFMRKPFVKVSNIRMTSLDEEFVKDLVRMIESEITSENLSVELLAVRMNVSRATLLRKVKNITGFSVVDFVRIIRLKKAAELLHEGKMKIKEVCYAVGISSESYFSRLFYKQFGVRPKDFEKQDKNENA